MARARSPWKKRTASRECELEALSGASEPRAEILSEAKDLRERRARDGSAPIAVVFQAMPGCIFCRIIRGESPSKKVYEDDRVYAFEDIRPQAPTHVLIVPKKHIVDLKQAAPEDAEIIGYCHLIAAKIARERKIEDGYRTVLNVGPKSGQSIFHLHLHLLGGRVLRWPPG